MRHMDLNDQIGWILGGIATVLATMATAVTTLWKASESKNAKAIEVLEVRASECERERLTLRTAIAELRTEIRLLERKDDR